MNSKSFWAKHSIRKKKPQPGNPDSAGQKPSAHIKMSPEKAKKILKDGTVHGKPLTAKQRGLFGAIAGRS